MGALAIPIAIGASLVSSGIGAITGARSARKQRKAQDEALGEQRKAVAAQEAKIAKREAVDNTEASRKRRAQLAGRLGESTGRRSLFFQGNEQGVPNETGRTILG